MIDKKIFHGYLIDYCNACENVITFVLAYKSIESTANYEAYTLLCNKRDAIFTELCDYVYEAGGGMH